MTAPARVSDPERSAHTRGSVLKSRVALAAPQSTTAFPPLHRRENTCSDKGPFLKKTAGRSLQRLLWAFVLIELIFEYKLCCEVH